VPGARCFVGGAVLCDGHAEGDVGITPEMGPDPGGERPDATLLARVRERHGTIWSWRNWRRWPTGNCHGDRRHVCIAVVGR
jgi:hypothetical protein